MMQSAIQPGGQRARLAVRVDEAPSHVASKAGSAELPAHRHGLGAAIVGFGLAARRRLNFSA